MFSGLINRENESIYQYKGEILYDINYYTIPGISYIIHTLPNDPSRFRKRESVCNKLVDLLLVQYKCVHCRCKVNGTK
jgi:hypothetical protein